MSNCQVSEGDKWDEVAKKMGLPVSQASKLREVYETTLETADDEVTITFISCAVVCKEMIQTIFR